MLNQALCEFRKLTISVRMPSPKKTSQDASGPAGKPGTHGASVRVWVTG